MKTLLLAIFLFTTPVSAYELDLSLVGSFSGGNKDTSYLGTSSLYRLGGLELKALVDYENTNSIVYRKYLGYATYEHELDLRWSLFGLVHAQSDTKRKIDLKMMEVVGTVVRLIPSLKSLKYSVGLGHRLENDFHSFVISHRLKWKKSFGRFEPSAVWWVYHGFDDYEVILEAGLRFKPYKTFRFGVVGAYNYDSAPALNVKKADYSVKMELVFNLSNDDKKKK